MRQRATGRFLGGLVEATRHQRGPQRHRGSELLAHHPLRLPLGQLPARHHPHRAQPDDHAHLGTEHPALDREFGPGLGGGFGHLGALRQRGAAVG